MFESPEHSTQISYKRSTCDSLSYRASSTLQKKYFLLILKIQLHQHFVHMNFMGEAASASDGLHSEE
jgi:hypothetical protein